MILEITNDGPRIASTNYWQSEYAARGALYLSINAGAFRLLLPPAHDSLMGELVAAREVVVSRGPWPREGRPDAIEILFDDGSSSPFAVHMGIEQIDRLPSDEAENGAWILTVWTRGVDGQPNQALSRPAYYRRSPKLPDLRPAGALRKR